MSSPSERPELAAKRVRPTVHCVHCGEAHSETFAHCPKTGRPLSTGAALVGREVGGRYRVLGLLSEGGMGAVYVAEHKLIGRQVALKRLHPELASNEKAVARFLREAKAAAATGHENIVEILDLGFAEDGAPFLVMEYLRGHTLAAVLRREGRLAAARACHIVGQVLAALSAVHREDIVHRDLKPDNVFLTYKGDRPDYVKVVDFGISKMKSEEEEPLDLTRTGLMLGTPFYMSPEQARGDRNLDRRVDLYAAGIILYESLSGQLPFRAKNYHALLQAIISDEPVALSERVGDLPPGLTEVVHRAIARERAERYQTAEELLQALLPFGASAAPPPAADIPPRFTLSGHSRIRQRENITIPGDRAPAASATSVSRPQIAEGPARAFRAASSDWVDHDPTPARTRIAIDAMRSHGGFTATEPAPNPKSALAARSSAPPSNGPASEPGSPDNNPHPNSSPPGARRGSDEVLGASASEVPASESCIKGSFLVAATDYLKQTFGPQAFQQIAAGLSAEHRAYIDAMIMPIGWFPLEAYHALLSSAERMHGRGDGSLAADIGAATAERELPTTHRLFMETATPEKVLARVPQVWKTYHNRGIVRVREVLGGSQRIEVEGFSFTSRLHALAMCGFYRRMMELAGSRRVRVGLLSTSGPGEVGLVLSLRLNSAR